MLIRKEYGSLPLSYWESLPALKKLLLTSSGSSSCNTPNGTSPTFRNTSIMYIITLVSDTPMNDVTIKLQDKKQAQKNAKELAELLHLEVENTLGT